VGADFYLPVPSTTQKFHVRGHLTPACSQTGDETSCTLTFDNVGLGFYVPNLSSIPSVLRPLQNEYVISDQTIARLGRIETFDTHLVRGTIAGESPLVNTVSAWLIGSVTDSTAKVRVLAQPPPPRVEPRVDKELIGWDAVTRVATYRIRITNGLAEAIRDVVIVDTTYSQPDATCQGGVVIDTQQFTIATIDVGQSVEQVVHVVMPAFTDHSFEAAIVQSYTKVATGAVITVQQVTSTAADPWVVCTHFAPTRLPMINEVVVEPQRDWNDSGAGGNGTPFDDVPGTGTVATGDVTLADQWLEFLTNTGSPDELRNWTLEFTDTNGVQQTITITPTMLRSNGGQYLVLGAPGDMSPTSVLILRDTTNQTVDRVDLGAIRAALGPATGVNDEAVARVPDGIQTNQAGDFKRRAASIGKLNP
jgi:hypothetical protein